MKKYTMSGNMKDPFLELQILSNELWNERKALYYVSSGRKRTVRRIEKLIEQIKTIDLVSELELIKKMNNI